MSRIARKDNIAKYFHVMVQGINREHIFEKDNYKLKYLKLIRECISETNNKLLAYCVMGNHIHLLIYIDNIESFSKMMASVNTKYAKYYNKIEDRCGYVYRDRFKSEQIKDQRHLENCVRYIHNNPVKAMICQKPSEYRYSSFNDFYNGNVEREIIELVFGKNIIDYKNILMLKNIEYSFIENEDDYEKPEIVLNEYRNLLDKINVKEYYSIICELKRRCNINNEEIAKILNLKKTKYYEILKIGNKECP